jgi:GPH family glycoside/pentoside/hexuronide:cation symporter
VTRDAAEHVSALRRVAYGVPAFALAAVGIPLYVHLPKFYTDVVGVDVTALGILLVVARVFDAVTDPLLGFLSDRTRTPFGRRRPYIAGAAVPLAASVYLLFTPPAGDPALATVWVGAWIFLMYAFWTAVVVPYESLGPEISFDYDERTALLGVREAFLIVGTLAGAVLPAVLRADPALPAGGEGERAMFRRLALLYGPLVVALCWWCVAATRERAPRPAEAGPGLLGGYRQTLANRPFAILLAAYTVSAIGGALPATLIFYYVEYVLGSDQGSLFLAIYFVVGFLCLPGWIAIARRAGKKPAWLAAMAVNTGAFVGVFFLGPGQTLGYGVLVAVSGVGFGATLAIPSAMQADVIDYDELLSGTRREGQYIGLWSIAKKTASALGVGIALPILDWMGYRPNVAQSPEVVLALRTLYAAVPCACNVVSFVIALAYPIDRARHAAIRRAIEARRQGAAVVDPLRPARLLGATA